MPLKRKGQLPFIDYSKVTSKNDLYKHCLEKISYLDENEANKFLELVKKNNPERTNLETYKCKYCPYYHHGTPPEDSVRTMVENKVKDLLEKYNNYINTEPYPEIKFYNGVNQPIREISYLRLDNRKLLMLYDELMSWFRGASAE